MEQVARIRADTEQERHQAIQALREMCLPKMERCAENRVEVGAAGGIELMVETLDIPNEDIKRSTCLALNEACLKNEANSRRFQSCGAIPRVMRVLESGNPDLQTQALAVLGTSAVNSVEVRRGLRDAGAIPLLVGLLASKNGPGVQEWAAYALRKASSRATDPQLGKSMIKQAIEAGGDRLLVEMLRLRSRDAQEEAQQTLEYFEVDVEHVQGVMKREEATKPLVAQQRMSWMAVWHKRLGAASPARRLPLELVELIAQLSAPAASEAVAVRWEAQGLIWTESLNFQKRTMLAEARVAELATRLADLSAQEIQIRARDKCLLALESRVERVDRQVQELQEQNAGAARRSSLLSMSNELTAIIGQLGARLGVVEESTAANVSSTAPREVVGVHQYMMTKTQEREVQVPVSSPPPLPLPPPPPTLQPSLLAGDGTPGGCAGREYEYADAMHPTKARPASENAFSNRVATKCPEGPTPVNFEFERA
eukprot:COSAG05_NODE_1111_length_5857_cov_6.789337_1_plen_484_part_00